MLDQKEVNAFVNAFEEFKRLKRMATKKLPERSILPVVDQRLYLKKDGSWEVRFMMSGYSMVKPLLKDLLKQYVFAVAGIEPTDEQIENAGSVVLERLTESLRQSLDTLQK